MAEEVSGLREVALSEVQASLYEVSSLGAWPMIGRVAVPDLFKGMNGLERDFAIQLEARKRAGLIHDWKYEALKLRLADSTFYTPDFLITHTDGMLEIAETKGFWEEDARVKIKVAAEMFPFKFTAHRRLPKKQGGGWVEEEF